MTLVEAIKATRPASVLSQRTPLDREQLKIENKNVVIPHIDPPSAVLTITFPGELILGPKVSYPMELLKMNLDTQSIYMARTING